MNIWIKYGPILYTLFRNNYGQPTIAGIIAWGMNNIVLPFLVLIFLYFFNYISLNEACNTFLVFLICFLVFSIWYEIGYLYNDIISIKKEKKPTMRIVGDLPKHFLSLSFIIRIFIGFLGNLGIYYLDKNLGILLLGLEILMLICYAIHNIFRNLYINYFSLIALRLSKYLVFILVMFSINNNIFYEIMQPLIFFFSLFQSIEITHIYNIKFGGEYKIDVILIYIHVALIQIVFYLLFGDIAYLAIFLYMLITIFHLGFSKIQKFKALQKS